MKRLYFLQILLILTFSSTLKAQSQELDYAKSRDYWIVDENQNPVVSKVFNLPQNTTKSDLLGNFERTLTKAVTTKNAEW